MERTLAHDLNNVLQTIAQAAELIAPGPDNDAAVSAISDSVDQFSPSKHGDLNQLLQTIAQATDLIPPTRDNASLASIIRRSVDQARRIIDGAGDPNPASSLSPIVHSAAQFVRDFSKVGGGPAISFAIDVSDSVWVQMPPAALERTLVNLFVNASEAARRASRDSVHIEVIATAANNSATINVRDNGPGIPEPALPHIFEPGYSGGATGSGLGLHIVQIAVMSAGGDVTAANRAGSPGAEFTLRIPTLAMAATA